MTSFVARSLFPKLDSLPRSYYLGHHAAGLAKMRTMLSQIDLIIECRDYRVPVTSHNPQFEEALAGKQRLIVYTKKDLGRNPKSGGEDQKREAILREWHRPAAVQFSSQTSNGDIKNILKQVEHAGKARNALTGSFLLVVGMPNVGKSSLLNALRRVGVGRGKVARTGAQPGVTRKIARSGVKIIETEDGVGSVYLVDTPGVFIPYVPSADSMLKLALCGSVKDTIIPPVTLADYLLFHINKHCPEIYQNYVEPTNDITELLEQIARKHGRLGKQGQLDVDASALWLIQRWRDGHFGHFVLDDVSEQTLGERKAAMLDSPVSISQARKALKEANRQAASAPTNL